MEITDRIRIRVYFQSDSEHLVKSWIARQPAPRSGLLKASYLTEDEWRPRLVFERGSGSHDWSTDPLFDDIDQYLTAWLDDTSVDYTARSRARYIIESDPRDIAPNSAWLLKASEAAYPSPEELHTDRAAADVGIFRYDWTTASQTQIGDLVLIYYVSPRKAVHFVARAASNAYFSRDVAVNADSNVSMAQWWSVITTPIEIEPLPVGVLREAAGGYLPLRGRSGLYLRPDTIQALQIRAADPADQAELDRVISVPVGFANLPDPADITHDAWRSLAAGALPLEAQVCSHIVEPLLRHSLAGTDLTWKREYQVGRRWADFVVLDQEKPVHVIEVKKVIREGSRGKWDQSADFAQLRWYADRLDTASTLIDSHRVLLVEQGAGQPYRNIIRRDADQEEFRVIRDHLVRTGK